MGARPPDAIAVDPRRDARAAADPGDPLPLGLQSLRRLHHVFLGLER